MDATEVARREAENLYIEAISFGDDPEHLLSFTQNIADRLDLDVYPVSKGDTQLKGGKAIFDCQARMILYEDVGNDFDQAFLIAHELGHVILEGSDHDFVTDFVEQDRSVDETSISAGKIIDYGPRERREVRMDIFARELLLPRFQLRRLHLEGGLSSSAIAQRYDAPINVVKQQLLDGLLLPLEVLSKPVDLSTPPLPLDETQATAAAHRDSAFLLQAGPGTGKTRTLVQRIETLLHDGIDPASILVLTFSNKAANELSDRIAKSNSSAATAMWIGTFHSFGLDIIRRFHSQLNLPPDPHLIDQIEAIELLENELSRLPFEHFRNLRDPTLDLSDMLKAISRAKDEICNANQYKNLAQSMFNRSAPDSEEKVRAEKCLEVAILYETYERLLKENNFIDFGDLVSKPVELVESNCSVREALKTRHRFVLVDEYQDVNRASVRLLKAIVDDGRNLWVVGDPRQSIYRFRGASSTNIKLFKNDFPNAVKSQLGVNYRSGQEIVNVFSVFSSQMLVSKNESPLILKANRKLLNLDPVLQMVNTKHDEVSAIYSSIKQQLEVGIKYRQHAVLCASNARLNEIARDLESRGVPVLYLGNFFLRPEIKELLALLSMLTDPYIGGLIAISQTSRFQMPLHDVTSIVSYLKNKKAKPLSWLYVSEEIPEIEDNSRKILQKIAQLFDGFDLSSNPWIILTTWVIDRLGYGAEIARLSETSSQMRGLAIWQFLNFSRNQPVKSGIPVANMLDRIRRLVLLNEDRSLRQVPRVAENINAVRILTVHASKGLEFDFVHIPSVVKTSLPRTNRSPRCLPPDGLIYGSDGMTGLGAVKAGHDEEEECLFFVALSRARNQLSLYAHTLQADGKNRKLSDFIIPIGHLLSLPPSIDPLQNLVQSLEKPIDVIWCEKPTWTVSQLSAFEKCPRRFLYTHVLELGGYRKETAFMKMHDVVYDVLDWLKANHETTNPTESEFEKIYEQIWQKRGVTAHSYSQDYQRIGKQLVGSLRESRKNKKRHPITSIILSFPQSDILVKPDTLSEGNNGQHVVGYIKTGKPKSNGFDDIEYTIFKQATSENYGVEAKAEVTYLTSATEITVSLTPKKFATRQAKLKDMLDDIHRGIFPTKEEVHICPSCPHFFICGTLPKGLIKK